MTAAPAPRTARERPILGTGRGRVVAVGIAVGSVLPIAAMHRYGDPSVARWAAAHRAADQEAFWPWAAFLGGPLFWTAASVVGFGIAAAFNWSNTARWMGMLALAVMWAGIADSAVAGEALGTATVGAVACVLTLWQSRGWPLWAGLGLIAATGRMIASGGSASASIVGLLLGILGALVVEFCWHAAAPATPPRRGAELQS